MGKYTPGSAELPDEELLATWRLEATDSPLDGCAAFDVSPGCGVVARMAEIVRANYPGEDGLFVLPGVPLRGAIRPRVIPHPVSSVPGMPPGLRALAGSVSPTKAYAIRSLHVVCSPSNLAGWPPPIPAWCRPPVGWLAPRAPTAAEGVFGARP